MGALVSTSGADKNVNILMLGLDKSGRTTILYHLLHSEKLEATLTTGLNLESLRSTSNTTCTFKDLTEEDQNCSLGEYHFSGTQGLLYIIDSADDQRLHEAREDLLRVLSREEFRDVPVVVLANKQDLPGAVRPEELAEMLGLDQYTYKWQVQGAAASSGRGIQEALDNLVEMVNEFKKKYPNKFNQKSNEFELFEKNRPDKS